MDETIWILIGILLVFVWLIFRMGRIYERRRNRPEPAPEPPRTPRRRTASHAQLDFIEDLCAELGRKLPPGHETLSRAEASLLIDELKEELKGER